MTKSRLIQITALVAIFAGCALRISLYVKNYSLFLDECALVLNVDAQTAGLGHGPGSFKLPPGVLTENTQLANQPAPLAFYAAEGVVLKLLGPSEKAARLVPLLLGLVTLIVFWRLNRQLQPGWPEAAAVWIAALNPSLISYSAQAKQYSMEALAAILILLLCCPFFREAGLSRRRFRVNAIFAALLLWFSFSAVFVLAAVGLTLLIESLLSRKRERIVRSLEAGTIWIAVFIPVFFVSIRPGLARHTLHDEWIADYMPRVGPTLIPWLASKAAEVCVILFNKRLWPLVGAVLVVGLVAAVRRKEWPYIAAAGGLFVCAIAAAELYPFGGRLLLFAVPGLIVVLVRGGRWIVDILDVRWRPVAQFAVAVAILWGLQSAVRGTLLTDNFPDEPREALRFMEQNWRPSDHIFATDYATPCLLYYSPELGLEPSAAELGVNAVEKQGQPTSLSISVPSGRVWLVEMRTPWLARGPSVPIQEFMEAHSRKLAQRDVQWTSVILFDKP